jgi:L-ascorbate metabolism protein UlaG (beta-lactamase superfamily)
MKQGQSNWAVVNPKEKKPGESVNITYQGTNSILIGDGSTQWLLDPHFTRPSKRDLLKRLIPDVAAIEAVLAGAGPGDLRAVILSHTHYDHALDAAETCRLTGATLIGSQSASFLAAGANLPPSQARVVHDGDCLSLGDFQLTFLVSRHILLSRLFNLVSGMHRKIESPVVPPAYFWQYKEGTVFTLFVRHPAKSFLISSSAGFFDHNPPGLQVDFCVLSLGGLMLKRKSYIRQYIQQMAVETGAKRIYLSHWDDFTIPSSSVLRCMPGTHRAVKRIIDYAYESDIQVQVLPYGEVIQV